MRKFAKTAWTIGDVQSLRPEMSDEEAMEWLEDNENAIRDVMIERGWAAMEDLLPPKNENI